MAALDAALLVQLLDRSAEMSGDHTSEVTDREHVRALHDDGLEERVVEEAAGLMDGDGPDAGELAQLAGLGVPTHQCGVIDADNADIRSARPLRAGARFVGSVMPRAIASSASKAYASERSRRSALPRRRRSHVRTARVRRDGHDVRDRTPGCKVARAIGVGPVAQRPFPADACLALDLVLACCGFHARRMLAQPPHTFRARRLQQIRLGARVRGGRIGDRLELRARQLTHWRRRFRRREIPQSRGGICDRVSASVTRPCDRCEPRVEIPERSCLPPRARRRDPDATRARCPQPPAARSTRRPRPARTPEHPRPATARTWRAPLRATQSPDRSETP